MRLTKCPHSRSSLMALMTTPGSSCSWSPCMRCQLLKLSPKSGANTRKAPEVYPQQGGHTLLCTSQGNQDSELGDTIKAAATQRISAQQHSRPQGCSACIPASKFVPFQPGLTELDTIMSALMRWRPKHRLRRLKKVHRHAHLHHVCLSRVGKTQGDEASSATFSADFPNQLASREVVSNVEAGVFIDDQIKSKGLHPLPCLGPAAQGGPCHKGFHTLLGKLLQCVTVRQQDN